MAPAHLRDRVGREDGVAFERGIVQTAPPIAMPPGGEAELFRQDRTLLDVRTFRNRRLRLIGRPDGLVTANGALQPTEIKSHRLLRHGDRIELAFYWLVLGEVRTDRAANPMGWVYLRTQDGSFNSEPVELTPLLLAETEGLVKAVRDARLHGVEPVICRCTVWRGMRRHEVREFVRARHHVSSVIGVGPKRRRVLEDLGCGTWEDLLSQRADDLMRTVNLAVTGLPVSVHEVRRWQSHARSLLTHQVLLADTAAPFPVPEQYLAFDAEYTAGSMWLPGVRLVRPEGDLCYAIWTTRRVKQRR